MLSVVLSLETGWFLLSLSSSADDGFIAIDLFRYLYCDLTCTLSRHG
jgi:hypothetical protein